MPLTLPTKLASVLLELKRDSNFQDFCISQLTRLRTKYQNLPIETNEALSTILCGELLGWRLLELYGDSLGGSFERWKREKDITK